MGMFWTVISQLHSLAGPGLMLLYPLYASVRAIESPSKLDDEQWLSYWILYSFIALLEMAAAPIFAWIPFWHQVKMVIITWLVLPQFRGAAFIYERFVGQQLVRYGQSLVDKDKFNENQRKFIEGMSPKARASVEHFISENGQDAFDRIIEAATEEAQKGNKLHLLSRETQERTWIKTGQRSAFYPFALISAHVVLQMEELEGYSSFVQVGSVPFCLAVKGYSMAA
eukprot:Gb_24347 [translate_table: standard]